MNNRIPFSQAILWIVLSTMIVSGSAFTGWFYFLHVKEKRESNSQYTIVALVQNCSSTDALKSVYLSELLGLSLDIPTNLYQFDIEKGKEKLLSSPVIQEAKLKKISPSALYVEYTMRQPMAYLGEFTHAAIDQQGVIFPVFPFYTPKKLPILILGLYDKSVTWGTNVSTLLTTQKAFDLLKQCQSLFSSTAEIKTIDVSKMDADSVGHREIVIKMEIKNELPKNEFFLRLNAQNPKNGLLNFLSLQESARNDSELNTILSEAQVIDLRLIDLAYITGSTSK